MTDEIEDLNSIARRVAESLDADILHFAGDISMREDHQTTTVVRSREPRRTNVLMMLTSFGGSADAAYRITRCLQECYKDGRLYVFVDSFCKSAGTLISVGASEIIMANGAEFGPLDVQMRKPDELDERFSGLTPMQAMNTLRSEAYLSFAEFFQNIRRETLISSKIAADIASQLTVGLFSSVYGQIEPMRLGENERAMDVAAQYGQRLASVYRNLKPNALSQLISGYPSHEFVIDRTEASHLFKSIRSPTADEERLSFLTKSRSLEFLFSERESLIEYIEFDSGEGDSDAENYTEDHPARGDSNGQHESTEYVQTGSDEPV